MFAYMSFDPTYVWVKLGLNVMFVFFLQIEAGQYCTFLIFSDGSMKACGKVSTTPLHVYFYMLETE